MSLMLGTVRYCEKILISQGMKDPQWLMTVVWWLCCRHAAHTGGPRQARNTRNGHRLSRQQGECRALFTSQFINVSMCLYYCCFANDRRCNSASSNFIPCLLPCYLASTVTRIAQHLIPDVIRIRVVLYCEVYISESPCMHMPTDLFLLSDLHVCLHSVVDKA